jgi:hypothetical protein
MVPGGYTRASWRWDYTDSLQNAVRRLLNKLMIRTASATMSSRWIRAPPKCRLKPKSHKIRRTTKIVQSMSTSFAHWRAPECESYPNVRKKTGCARTDRTTNDGFCASSNMRARAVDKQRQRSRPEPYSLLTLASALAPRTSARNGSAATGIGTLPNSKARVVTLRPYIARRESLS